MTAPPLRSNGVPSSQGRRRGVRTHLRRHAVPYLFLLPGLVLFAGLMAWPLVQALRISLYHWNILPGANSDFIGLDNYVKVLADENFWRALVNTVAYTALTVPTQMALGMAAALLLNRPIRGRVFFRALFYLPVVTSWVVVSLLFKYMFNSQAGFINYLLSELGFGRVDWFGNRWSALIAVSVLGVWKGIGWSMLIFLAALQGVPKELMEAAELDGASGASRFFRVTLPLLRSSIVFVTVMLIIGGFNVFTSVFLMTGGGPAHQTDVVLSYMYSSAFNNDFDFGYGAAIAFLLFALISALSGVQLRLFSYGKDV